MKFELKSDDYGFTAQVHLNDVCITHYTTDVDLHHGAGYPTIQITMIPDKVDIAEENAIIKIKVGDRVFRVIDETEPRGV